MLITMYWLFQLRNFEDWIHGERDFLEKASEIIEFRRIYLITDPKIGLNHFKDHLVILQEHHECLKTFINDMYAVGPLAERMEDVMRMFYRIIVDLRLFIEENEDTERVESENE